MAMNDYLEGGGTRGVQVGDSTSGGGGSESRLSCFFKSLTFLPSGFCDRHLHSFLPFRFLVYSVHMEWAKLRDGSWDWAWAYIHIHHSDQVCHSNHIVHRDIKPQNLVFKDESETPVKIVDFGISTLFAPGEILQENIGTLAYTAPEVLQRKYGPECDIWSAGVTLYELLVGVVPYAEDFSIMPRAPPDFKRAPWPNVSP
ncbi:unnamed protein product [Cuscuta campestris]|uniref:Protein kinase domain-containing protein n=1 Tax=Cuscuta campestris TaxID=132261 RepID=A0A484M771_9ASTE|nr:unnamed protein product [Cuscuta campestris]